ncbi:Protein kinase domain-containing protein [Hirschfeldia incana]|nr:Protein kinase domain-containing protein [Hirschfeldia incana]KAJ0241716.1 Protein kinase domain-containing protein [Hirschfeldia incana]
MAAGGGVEISKSSVVVTADRVRDFYPRQGVRDGDRRQTKRSGDFDRRLNDGRRDAYQRQPEKRRKCSPVSGERKDQVFRPALGEKAIVDVSGVKKISTEDRVGVLKSTEDVSAVSVQSVKHPFDDLEEGQLEDEQVVQAPNIATSKWCLESPKDEAVHVVKNSRWNRSSMSPESGEFQVEASDERRSNSSGSRSLEPLSAHGNSEQDVGEEECSASDLNDSGADEPEGGLSMLSGSRDVNEYQKLSKINEGTYGVVYKAKDRKTEEIVALKMIKMNMEDEYGFPLTSLREINILLSCNHPSIVNVKEVVVGNGDSVFMVMEHLEHDLRGVMDRMKQPFSTSEVKCLMVQLLEGLKYLHSNWIIHRDLKPSNLLLNNSGELKICDFGMARQYGSPIKPYTQLVVTQWYRSPELLLGTKEYSTAVDMWSIGCIMDLCGSWNTE